MSKFISITIESIWLILFIFLLLLSIFTLINLLPQYKASNEITTYQDNSILGTQDSVKDGTLNR